jgi:hypothetical protein
MLIIILPTVVHHIVGEIQMLIQSPFGYFSYGSIMSHYGAQAKIWYATHPK